MTCNQCRYNREIARLTSRQNQLREICSKCRLSEEVAGDGSISLNTIQDGTIDRVAKVAPNHPTTYIYDPGEIDEPRQEPNAETTTWETLTTLLACVAALPYEHVSRLTQIADVFKNLTQQEFEIVAHLLNGGTMIAYAEKNGLTKQTAFARIKALFKAYPMFRAIANGGLTHGKGGRKAAPRDYTQLTLFDVEGC